MSNFLRRFQLAHALAMLMALPAHSADGSVAGQWLFHFERFGETYAPARVLLNVDRTSVTGRLNELTITGSVHDDRIDLRMRRPDGREFGRFIGRAEGTQLRGTMEQGGQSVDWSMRRLPPKRAAAVHDMQPDRFVRTFNAATEPLIRLQPGDTLRSSTLDSSGHDAAGVRRAFGGNPQTGPVYVEGALPGDTLVVHVKRLTLTRNTASSGNQLVPVTVTHDYHRNASYDGAVAGDWILDREANTARLAHPSEALRDYRVPLRPFLGGIGVAPPEKQAIDARALGAYGGNLDYNALVEGTTIYLPIFQEGGLLFFGDGHAAQGDGELRRRARDNPRCRAGD